ncbi:OFA family MFS transporter [Micromonospora sp. HM5-17]|uniref:OFA family MFS transporter n=1 Tax=Micromonospora sp. HM5-17 TaxID=2487710 RepID=UPI000F45FC73|nr:OFA family MFS transporter [Micromonospora sp. HM5-17]ROT33054.1 MFS transporter [Micromonospora sp. HM5-17]
MDSRTDTVTVREISDFYGRRYRIGESDRALLGRSRAWMTRLPWAAMLAVSLFQYGFGAALPTLTGANGWSLGQAFAVLGLWVVCQAASSPLGGWLYQRLRVRLAAPMLIGAACCLTALVTLAHSSDLRTVLLGYSVLGGIGTGLVYMTCVATVTEWFPERIAGRVAMVGAAFGYGAIPFVVFAGYALDPGNRTVVLDATAVVVFLIVAGCGLLMRKPPRNWWPAEIDPRRWAVDRRLNRSIPHNRPAVRPYPPRAAWRSGMLPMMFVAVVLTAAMALFDIAYLAGSAHTGRLAAPTLVAAMGVLAAANGVGRAVTSSLSDRIGRRGTLGLALLVGGVAQFGLLAAAANDNHPAVAVGFAALAGAGTGAGYSLLVSLVRDWFGDDATVPNYGIVYTGKAVGGVLGIVLAGLVVTSPDSAVPFVVAGCLGLLGAALTRWMRQPGLAMIRLPSPLGVDRV